MSPSRITEEDGYGGVHPLHDEVYALLDADKEIMGVLTVIDNTQIALQLPTAESESAAAHDKWMKLPDYFEDLTPEKQIEYFRILTTRCAQVLAEKKGISAQGVINALALINDEKEGWARYSVATASQLNHMFVKNHQLHFRKNEFAKIEDKLKENRVVLSRN